MPLDGLVYPHLIEQLRLKAGTIWTTKGNVNMHNAFFWFSGFLFYHAEWNVRWFGGIVMRGCASRSLLGSYVHQK